MRRFDPNRDGEMSESETGAYALVDDMRRVNDHVARWLIAALREHDVKDKMKADIVSWLREDAVGRDFTGRPSLNPIPVSPAVVQHEEIPAIPCVLRQELPNLGQSPRGSESEQH